MQMFDTLADIERRYLTIEDEMGPISSIGLTVWTVWKPGYREVKRKQVTLAH